MSRPRHHEIVEVHRCGVYDELAEIVRQENISQTMIAKEILRSSGLCKMVDSVASGEVDGIHVEIVIRG